MDRRCCAVLGHDPMRFAWGFDEKDDRCVAFKIALLLALNELTTETEPPFCATQFAVVCDPGVGLYAAEAINALRTRDPDLHLYCVLPWEDVAVKWAPYLRERHFFSLALCTYTTCLHRQRHGDSQLAAYQYAIDLSDCVLAVYDPSSSRGDAVDKAIAYAKAQGKPIQMLHPDTLELSVLDPHSHGG